jgi:hypothetical protein
LSHRGNIAAIQHADSTDEMQNSHLLRSSSGSPLPERFLSRLVEFADLFTRPTWSNVLVLLAGVILAPGRRTVSAALRILGRECDPDFCTFHRILNRAAWSSRAVARQLLIVLIKALVPSGAPVVIGLDDTIERRWGTKISARGIYRDPVRSSKGHFVKASGLRWLSAMLLVKVPWADRVMALPFLTLLAPSKRFYAGKMRAPKTLLDWARQAALQIHRWLPDRYIVLVADSAFAAIEFLAAVRNHACVVTRLRLDANLFGFPPQKPKGRGRPPIKGKPHKKLSALIKDRKVSWKRYRVSLWYGRTNRLVDIASGTAVSQRRAPGADPLASRPRSQRRARTAGLPRHQPQRSSLRHPRLVRQSLAGRSNIRGSSRSSRRRDPASVVRQGDPSHHAGPAWIILNRHPLGTRPRQITKVQAENHCMVSKSGPDLQRRDRGRAPRNLAQSDFFYVPAEPRQYKNSAPYLEPNGKCTRSRRMNRPKSS